MVKLQVKDEKVKYEFPDVDEQFNLHQLADADLKIKYAIANELVELNRTMKTIKMAMMNMSQTTSDQFYKRS